MYNKTRKAIALEELFKTLPQHSCSWLPGDFTFLKYQDFWCLEKYHLRALLVQENFKAQPSDIFLCSLPKSGTTWLKALTFAIVTRKRFDESTSPLLTNLPHKCVPFLEAEFEQIQENRNSSLYFPLVATHLPYHCLPESFITSNCKIVYIYRNLKDVIVSNYHYARGIVKVPMEDAPIEKTVEEFCQGISGYGPYWDHIMGFLKASLEKPEIILLLKYEDLQTDPVSNVKKLAKFIGYPFTTEEEKAGVVENIIKLCSFDNLSNLEVNKTGKQTPKFLPEIQHRLYFRKGKDGDWKNYLTDEMTEKIDTVIDEKMSGTGLVLK